MRILLIALGSAGDVHPFIPLGRELSRRGHQVLLFANEVFRCTVEAAGLAFVPVGDRQRFEELTADPDLFDSLRGARLVFGETLAHLRELEELLLEHAVPERTVMVGSSLAFAARLLQEAEGIPLVTVHLSPAVLRSVHQLPKLPAPGPPDRAPRWVKKLYWRLADWVLDRVICPPLNAERRRLGLEPVQRPLDGWWHSPELVLGLFPEWYAPRQPDWPGQLRLTGFPLFREEEHLEGRRGRAGPDPELEAWLGAGEAPVALTAGSAHRHGRAFFAAGVEACRRLGRRGLLLTQEEGNLPRSLPEGFLHRAYLPFGQVLPRVAALVHHGGIGTVAQAFAAGIPQLIVPFAHDQPDNGARVERLGAGARVSPRRFRLPHFVPGSGPRVLGRLLESPEVAERCRDLARRVESSRAVEESCDWIEGVG